MNSIYQKSISLFETMTIELPYTTRVWDVPGLQISRKDIPTDAQVKKTFVIMHSDGNTTVGVEYTISRSPATYMKIVAKSPQLGLKELEKQFPSLFKITGSLHAFGSK